MQQNNAPFLTVEQASALALSTPKTFYAYLCNSGVNGGKKRSRFPPEIYIKMGRKTLFIREKFIEWLLAGANMHKNP